MTKLLEKAFAEASALPEEEQDRFAALMLDELDSERRWDELFANSQDELDLLAERAIAAHRAGKSKPLSFDQE